ncbi:metallophosphoesterase [candidate division WWE3 bacterium]|uniref:Metallophosphoesterase n=1 Tax=candidate division WWE3 bacterium TaxID=2053526 RepID=A0A955RRQ7_UNCKA|nr:metallophosphoesterase [candidate division WWE3 bacterium]
MPRKNYSYKRRRFKQLQVVLLAAVLISLAVCAYLLLFKDSRLDLSGFNVDSVSSKLNDLTLLLEEKLPGNDTNPSVERHEVLRIGVMSDSHGADGLIQKAVNEMNDAEVNVILHLGDFSEGGEIEHFENAKEIFEKSGIAYHVLPGDHDFNWVPNYSRENFEAAFGSSYNQAYVYDKIGIILFENSIQLTGSEEIDWLKSSILNLEGEANVIVVFSARPLYSPYFPSKQDNNGGAVIDLLIDSGVKYAFAGDTHIFAEYRDLSDVLNIITVGAVGEYKNPLPQWVLVVVYDDGSIEVSPQPLVRF